jgi:selenocysteine lyase/cysteine desulfurase
MAIPEVRVFDQGTHLCNILTFRKGNLSQQEINKELERAGIFYSFSGKNYALIDYQKKGVDWTVRLSPHYFNTPEEVDKVLNIVDSL